MIKAIDANMYLYLFVENIAPIQVEKPRDFDPFGHAGLSPLVTI